MEAISDNLSSHVIIQQTGIAYVGTPKGYEVKLLNIRYGNGASVVVRAGESLVHGEGKQLKV